MSMVSILEEGKQKGFLTFDELYGYIEKHRLSQEESEKLFEDCSKAGISLYNANDDDDPYADVDESSSSAPYESSLRIYMEEAKKIPIMSHDEQKKWLAVYKAGGKDSLLAKNKLIESNLALVISIAKKYRGFGLPFEDVIQEGNLGLMQGLEKFDATRDVAISTYVTFWIRQKISRAIIDKGYAIRIPVAAYTEMDRIRRYCRDVERDGGDTPTAEEISKNLNMPLAKVKELMMNNNIINMASLDMPIGEEDDSYLGDMIPDQTAARPDEIAMSNDLPDAIMRVLSSLANRERDVLILRYGLNGGDPMTLEEVGRIMHVTRERVRQIEAKALRKLRNPRLSEALKAYTDM